MELLEDRDYAFLSPVLSLVLAFIGCSINVLEERKPARKKLLLFEKQS